MYCISKKEFQKDRIKVLILGFIIGVCAGAVGGFFWAATTFENMISVAVTSVPQQMTAIPF